VAICQDFWPRYGQMKSFHFIFITIMSTTKLIYCSILSTMPQFLSLFPSPFQQDSSGVQGEWGVTGAGGSSMSGPCILIRLTAFMFLWNWLTLSLLQSWLSVGASAADSSGAGFSGSSGPLGWLLSEKGPFHNSQEFVDFTERYQQGFTTKYKIYRWEQCQRWLNECWVRWVQAKFEKSASEFQIEQMQRACAANMLPFM